MVNKLKTDQNDGIQDVSSENDRSGQSNDPELSKIPLLFNYMLKRPEDTSSGKKGTIPTGPSRKKAKKGQKEVQFESELNEDVDPIYLNISSPGLARIRDDLNLYINDEQVSIWVDEKDHFGSAEFRLTNRIKPQFSVGYFKDDILKLWLVKHLEAGEAKNVSPEQMIWCSNNIIAEREQEKERAQQYLERFHQVQLDYQNLVVSSKREMEEFSSRYSSQLLLNVLDVMDNFERALDAAKKPGGDKNLITGVEMISKQLEGVLVSNGVSEIDALNKLLDPLKHEVFTTEVTSEVPENTVTEVIQKGYMLNDKVLRFAKVKVAKPITAEECKTEL